MSKARTLKSLPVLITTSIALIVGAPFDFITGRRLRTVPSGLSLELMETQQRLQKVAAISIEGMTPTEQSAHVAQQIPLMYSMFDVIARLLNAVIVESNLHEYARPDGQPFSRAGHLTRDDVIQMPDDLRNALLSAAMAKTSTPDADREKKDAS
jgi:hypothetical protein